MYNKPGKQLSNMVFIALMTAIISVLSPLSIPIPFSLVPLSLATFILYVSTYVIGPKSALISCGLYLLLGAIGLPVFSGFTGGIGKLAGPTGGFLIGYLCIPFISLILFPIIPYHTSRVRMHFLYGLTFLLGTCCCYFIGTMWLLYQTNTSLSAAILTSIIPFLPTDLCKLILSIFVGSSIRNRLQKSGIL